MVKLPEPQRAKKTKTLKSKKYKWKQKEGKYRKFDISLYIICSLLLPNFATRRTLVRRRASLRQSLKLSNNFPYPLHLLDKLQFVRDHSPHPSATQTPSPSEEGFKKISVIYNKSRIFLFIYKF